MKCVFCAEEIKDEAQLCRYCGARRVDGNWQPPATSAAAPARKKNFTLQSSGWLLILSGVWSLITVTSPVALFGGMRTGVVAVLYNALIAAAFLGMGVGLARLERWAMQATWAASAVYTLDKVLFLVDTNARRAATAEGSQLVSAFAPGMEAMVDQAAVATACGFLVGWWAFILFVWMKRDVFTAR